MDRRGRVGFSCLFYRVNLLIYRLTAKAVAPTWAGVFNWRGGWKDFKGRLLPVYLWGAGAAAACQIAVFIG